MRELPAYVLTVDKKGVRIPLHDPADLKHDPIGGRFQDGELHLSGKNVPMNYFAFFLSRALPLNVVDKTGLTDRYDVEFHYVPGVTGRETARPRWRQDRACVQWP